MRANFERLEFQRFELSGVGAGLRAPVVLFFLFLVAFFLGFFLFRFDSLGFLLGETVGVLGVRIDQAVDEFVDAHFLVLDPLGHRQNVGDGRRARGDRHDHVLQAIFDALCDLDLALARQQFDRAHLAHVHAYGVGRAAELGIDGGERDFGLFLDFVVGRSVGRVVVQKERFGIGRLFVHRHAHVIERADDAFDRLGFREVVRQVIVDLAISESRAPCRA